MTLSLELPLDLEARLREQATVHGQALESYVLRLLNERMQENAAEFDDAVAAIREGIADGEAGREQPFAEFVVEARAARAVRRARDVAQTQF